MGRKKKGIPLHGWLIIDKPLEVTSTNVVSKVRWVTKAQKVGHGGTLDPLATGILPLALGEATKTVPYVMDGEKTYRFEITWGEERTTDDLEGEVSVTSDVRPSEADIQTALKKFIGIIDQVPPKYSAIKVNGQRSYKLAREDQAVELCARKIEIKRLVLEKIVDANRAIFEVDCGKGTYIRSLGRDLARHLGTCGYISMLRRTKVGPFLEKDAISLDLDMDIVHSEALLKSLLPIETVLDDISVQALTEDETQKVRQGMSLKTDRPDCEIIRLMSDNKVVALATISEGQVRPFRVFNY